MKTKIIIAILAFACISGYAANTNIVTDGLSFIRIKKVAQMNERLLSRGVADVKAGDTQFVATWTPAIATDDYSTATTLPTGITITDVVRTRTNCTFTVSGPMPADRGFAVIALKP